MVATTAASVAISVAKDQLEKEMRLLTEKYKTQLDVKKGKLMELSAIDLDTETADFFMDRLTEVSQGEFLVNENGCGKILCF